MGTINIFTNLKSADVAIFSRPDWLVETSSVTLKQLSKKSRIDLMVTNDQQNMKTVEKYKKMFYGRHTTRIPAVMKINRL